MEPVSAFAAYQTTLKTQTAKQKSPKAKKQKNKNARPNLIVRPTKAPKKRKQVQPSESEPPKQSKTTTSIFTAAVESDHNSYAKAEAPKKKKKTSQSKSPVVANGTEANQHDSPSTSSNSRWNANASSVEKGSNAFTLLLCGVKVKKFMTEHWEKIPLYIERHNNRHYDHLGVSTKAIDKMLRTNSIEFTKNLDITSYENGVRETHNPDGRAFPGTVWGFYRDGCSVRLINPQTFMSTLHEFNATLQEYFHCLVGANIYLTPPHSQGFAPHYDDIEAFVLQIEGKKEWMLYPPRSENEALPRESSGNFDQNEIGDPVFSHILNPGDLLYFPRGWIHQARTIDDSHSLHITLSVYQKNSYADLLEVLTKQALKSAIETNLSLRKGVPLDIWNQFGQTYTEYDMSERRNTIKTAITKLFRTLKNHIDLDEAVDKMALKYQHDALPPVLSSHEKVRTTFGTKPVLQKNGKIHMPEMNDDTKVRLIRSHIVRLIYEDGAHLLYYYADNSKEYHGSDLNFMELEEPTVQVVKKLIHSYPKYMNIKDLSENDEEAMAVVYSLWDRGLLMTKLPLE